jgi:predicted transcriptional regulator
MSGTEDQPVVPYARPPLLVRDVATFGLISCSRQSTAAEVAELLRRGECPAVAIREHGTGQAEGRVWGIVSCDDVVRAVAADDPRISAEALARTPAIRIRTDQTVREAARVMDAAHVSGLLVIDQNGRATGWLSSADLARGLAASQ